MRVILDLSMGMYLGLLIGLMLAAAFARLFWREAAEVVVPRPAETTAPRLVDVMHADPVAYRTN